MELCASTMTHEILRLHGRPEIRGASEDRHGEASGTVSVREDPSRLEDGDEAATRGFCFAADLHGRSITATICGQGGRRPLALLAQ